MGAMLTVFLSNIVFCAAALWFGLWLGKQV
jgi:CrcB protein